MELAHISDLHIRAPFGPWTGLLSKRLIGTATMLFFRRHDNAILEAAMEDLRRRPPDHLVVTGDLTNLTLESELEAVTRLIASAGLPPERLSVIPGNHDAYVRGPFHARRFEHHVGPLLGEPALAWPRTQRSGEALIVSLTSAVPTPWFTAFGRVGADQLARADALLAASDAPFKVVLMHHPPVEADGRPDPLIWRRNLDTKALLELAHARGVDLILCGHTHTPFRAWTEGAGPKGRLLVSCAGSTSKRPKALGHAATYYRYRIEGGRLVEVETRGFCPERREFVSIRRESP